MKSLIYCEKDYTPSPMRLIFAVLILGIAYFFVSFHRLALVVISDSIISNLGINVIQLGVLGSAYFYSYAIMQIPCGYITDRFGSKAVVILSLIITSIGSILFGIAQNMTSAFTARVLIGLGVACIYVPSLNTFREWFGEERFGLFTGFMMSIGILGGLCASKPLVVINKLFGWRSVFIGSGVISAILVMPALFILLKKKSTDTVSYVEQQSSVVSTSKVIFSPDFLILAIWFFVFIGIQLSFQGLWAAPFLNEALNLNYDKIGTIMMFFSIGTALGCVFSGYFSDKIGNIKMFIIFGVGFSVSWFFIALLSDSISYIFTIVLFMTIGILSGGVAPVSYACVRRFASSNNSGILLGIANFAGFIGSAIFMQFTGNVMEKIKFLGNENAYKVLYVAYSIISLVLVIMVWWRLRCPVINHELQKEIIL